MTLNNRGKFCLLSIFFVFISSICFGQGYEYLRSIPSEAPKIEKETAAIAMGPNGSVYMLDKLAKSIMVFDVYGNIAENITRFPTAEISLKLEAPRAICVDSQNQLYVYDESLGKIIKRSSSGLCTTFGEKGSELGQIREITGLAVDSKGYCYALNSEDNRIDVFYPDGTYLTWITGTSVPFEEILSIGVNDYDELYVLENPGPNLYVFDIGGNLVNTNRNLSNRKNITIKNIVDMTVLANGEFILLDGETCQSIHFSRVGELIGTVGSKGSAFGNGVFKNATHIRSCLTDSYKIVILDASTQQVQMFNHKSPTQIPSTPPKRVKMSRTTTARKPAHDLVVAPNNSRYVIPANDHKKVIAYKDTSEIDLFTLTGQIKDAFALAADQNSNLYVVDRGNDEVLMYDLTGAIIRKLGQEIPEKLRDPVSIVIQKNGNVIVADRSRESLYMWTSSGVFSKVITSKENSIMRAPKKIQCDSKDQIYVLDEEANCIYRIGATGWPTSEKKLMARPLKPGEKAGTIIDFFVDPLDQIHLFNETTQQIETYTWEVDPVLKFSMGRPGDGINSFKNIDHMLLDRSTLSIYFTSTKDKSQKVYQYLLPPPMPEGSVLFDVVDGKLNVQFVKSKSTAVIAYGLITSTAKGDSLAFKTTSSNFVITQPKENHKLYHYNFVTISWNDFSDPSFGFDDYFSYAESMIDAQRYEEAKGSWQLALEKFGRPKRMTEYIAHRMAELSVTLVKNFDIENAISYARTATELLPSSNELLSNLQYVLKAQYIQFANQGNISGLIAYAETYASNDVLKKIAWSAMDTVAQILSLEESLNSINTSIRIEKKLLEWDRGNPAFAHSLESSYFSLYKFKSIRETSALELKTILDETLVNGEFAYKNLKAQGKPYFEAQLTYLEAQCEMGSFEDVVRLSSFELGSSSALMTQSTMIAYRKILARAFSALGQPDLAAQEYDKILGLMPKDIEVTDLMADALIARTDYTSAKNILQQLTIGNSDNSYIIARIGYIELLNGNYKEAIFQLEKALKKTPTLLWAHGYLAEAYDKSGMTDKAVEYYEVAIQYLDESIIRFKQSTVNSTQIQSFSARRENYLLNLARINYELSNFHESRKYYERTTQLNPSNAAAFNGLGDACRNTGRIYEALASYNKALALDTINVTYRSARDNAIKLRDDAQKNQKPLSILDIENIEIFPSLYRNYSDIHSLPVTEIVISNNSTAPILPTSANVFCKDLMSEPTVVKVPEIAAQSEYRLRIPAIFSDNILKINDQKNMQIEVVINYTQNDGPSSVQKTFPLVVHGRNAIVWSDKRRLASFVSPNEEKLIELNKSIDTLFRNNATYGMNKSLLKAIQIYTILTESSITYSSDPTQSYSTKSIHQDVIDYLQFPLETMERKGGDCDDLVALYTAILENGGISTAYIDLPGHVMAAFDCQIKPEDVNYYGLNASEVIITNDRVWIPVEVTMISKNNFFSAWKEGARRFYAELEGGNYPELIPFADAWEMYKPASYAKDNFSPSLPNGKDILDIYDTAVEQLVSKTKRAALEELSTRYQIETLNTYVKNAYAMLLAQTGEIEKARDIFKEALALSPDNAILLNNIGNTYLLESNYLMAIDFYLQASSLDEEDPQIFINLCKAYLSAGNKVYAKTYFDKAVAIDPELNTVYFDIKTQLK
jgi:tetratricopeptide (TPR) repeat protein/DNA-binding beta-propeller fold protein YncE